MIEVYPNGSRSNEEKFSFNILAKKVNLSLNFTGFHTKIVYSILFKFYIFQFISFSNFIEKFKEQLRKPVQLVIGNLGDTRPAETAAKKTEGKSKEAIAAQLAKLGDSKPDENKEGGLPGEGEKKAAECKQAPISHNVTLKGGRKAGDFKEVPHVKDMKDCIKHCCEADDKKCNLAFMLSNTCYAVACKSKESCVTMPAPPSSFHPQISMVRKPESADKGAAKIGNYNSI